jgi:hypothetical protein
MLAAMGYITPEITDKRPGYLSPTAGLKFADVPNGLATISKVPAAGLGQILAYMVFCETSQDQFPGTAASEGDFRFKALTSSDPLLHLPPGLWRPLLLDGRVGAGASELHELGLPLGDSTSRGGCCSRAYKGCAHKGCELDANLIRELLRGSFARLPFSLFQSAARQREPGKQGGESWLVLGFWSFFCLDLSGFGGSGVRRCFGKSKLALHRTPFLPLSFF